MAELESAGRLSMHRYRFAQLLSWDAGGLTLGFDPEQYELMADPDKDKQLAEFLRARFDRKIAVSVRALTAAEQQNARSARSLEELDRERAADTARRKREEVLGNRAYIMLKERFQPVNVEINTDV